jgi:hypothetical protein
MTVLKGPRPRRKNRIDAVTHCAARALSNILLDYRVGFNPNGRQHENKLCFRWDNSQLGVRRMD